MTFTTAFIVFFYRSWVKKWAVFDHEDRSLWDFFVALSPRSSEYLEATHSSLKRDLADNRIAVLDKDSSPEADTKLDNTDAALKDVSQASTSSGVDVVGVH